MYTTFGTGSGEGIVKDEAIYEFIDFKEGGSV